MNSENEDVKSFTPREYQIEILDVAKKRNTIACLGTGTGKTYIAVLLIRENSYPVRKSYAEGGKRIFFLVPTVPLVFQQAKTIQDHTDLKVKPYCGDMDVDSWSSEEWEKQFSEAEVLVMTAEIFRIIIDHSFMQPHNIQLLIFDECHRAQGNHPYRQAMKRFVGLPEGQMPHIFGLSASLLNGKCKPSRLERQLRELEMTLQSTIITASDVGDVQKYGTDPDEYIVYYTSYDPGSDSKYILENIQKLANELRLGKKEEETKLNAKKSQTLGLTGDAEETSQQLKLEDYKLPQNVIFFDKPVKNLMSVETIFTSLGPWCAKESAEIYLKEMSYMSHLPERHHDMREKLTECFLDFIQDCNGLNQMHNSFDLDKMPSKLNTLLRVFLAMNDKLLKMASSVSNNEISVTFEKDPEEYNRQLQLQEEVKDNLSCIIFVEQRITAFVLCMWLKKIKEVFRKFSFLKPEFIVGHGNVGSGEINMNEASQRKKIAAFREKKCNVLVATSVLEEGMDIRQCNLVVRFDKPMDFRSYVQSKGRARAKDSIYVLLIEKNVEANLFLSDIETFKTLEKFLSSNLQGRSQPSESEIACNMEYEMPPFMPYGSNGPRITMNSAISVINRYCANLPSDMATRLAPQWIIKEKDDDSALFECYLRLPINSPLRKTIKSEPYTQKRLAKMCAALKACKLLYELGEMNEHLVPLSVAVEESIADELKDLEEEEEIEGVQAGTHRRRQVYMRHTPVFLQDSKPVPSKLCYLHVLKMKLVEPLPSCLNPRLRPLLNPDDCPVGIGILSATELPPINSFPVFTKSGKIMVNVKPATKPFAISEEECSYLETFHRFIFEDTLCLTMSFFDQTDSSAIYVVPTKSDASIDWEFVMMTLTHPYKSNKEKAKKGSAIRTEYDQEIFKDAVFVKSFDFREKKNEHPDFHFVVNVEKQLSPLSPCNFDSSCSFKEFIRQRHGIKISIDEQPMLQTVTYPKLNLWKPIYNTTKQIFKDREQLSKGKQNHKSFKEFSIPELCILHPFRTGYFHKVICLPTILFRVTELLNAEEIRRSVAKEFSVGTVDLPNALTWKPFHLETSDHALRKELVQIGQLKVVSPGSPLIPKDIIKRKNGVIVEFASKINLQSIPGPNPSLLIQALTTKGSNDEFDLERLELIGDSFLKFVMTVKTFYKYPSLNEGGLSSLRTSLIQNKTLYRFAKKRNIAEFMRNSWFDCKETWLPPGYTVEDEQVDPNSLIKKTKSEKQKANKPQENGHSPEKEIGNLHLYFKKQVISDKNVADCVEALIGSYLLSCGQEGALRFMQWVGMDPLTGREDSFSDWPPLPDDPVVNRDENFSHHMDFLTNGFDRFEEIINYKFKDKAFLLMAFTHPSYTPNEITDCYQKLEFLGDAVLDYLITRQLYEDPNCYSPGRLTDLRSALVNNIFFAWLAVKNHYHEFLKILAPGLFDLVNKFVVTLRENEEYQFFEKYGYCLEEKESFKLEEVECPKALGDVFESVAGAIYLDSGLSLNTVWEVCYPMIKECMNHLKEMDLMSPVRKVYETVQSLYGTETAKTLFSDIVVKDSVTYIRVTLPNGKEYMGTGPNKKVAKRSVAKRVLADLNKANITDDDVMETD